MIETEQTTTCLACGRPLTQKGGRGHRKRLYCDNRGKCRQRAHRKQAKSQEQDQDQEVSAARIAVLEQEVKELRERLRVEERFRTDVQVRYFKTWLRRHPQPQDTDFFKRFLADTRLPQHASRAMYEALLRRHGYIVEEIALFQARWKDMLFEL